MTNRFFQRQLQLLLTTYCCLSYATVSFSRGDSDEELLEKLAKINREEVEKIYWGAFVQPMTLEMPRLSGKTYAAEETVTIEFFSHHYSDDQSPKNLSFFVKSNGETVKYITVQHTDSEWQKLSDNAYAVSFKIGKYWLSGDYTIENLSLRDERSNTVQYENSSEELASRDVQNPLAFTVENDNGDSTPPVVEGLSLASESVKAGELLKFKIRAYDDVGIQSLSLLVTPEHSNRGIIYRDESIEEFRVEGKDIYVSVRLNEYLASGKYFIQQVWLNEVSDPENGSYLTFNKEKGYYEYYGRAKISETFEPFERDFFTVEQKIPDTTAPKVSAIKFNKAVYKRGERGILTFKVNEEGSGINDKTHSNMATNVELTDLGMGSSMLEWMPAHIWMKDCKSKRRKDISTVSCTFEVTKYAVRGRFCIGKAKSGKSCSGQLSFYDNAQNHADLVEDVFAEFDVR